jgi:hypothetical protein
LLLDELVLSMVDEPVVLPVVLPVAPWVLLLVFGELLFLLWSPSARAEPLASATIEVKMNAGASLRIWAS